MNKLDYNFHSHTYRCGHASGTDEEYIKTAIEGGFKEYGVSDHVILPDIVHPNMRGSYSQLDDYIKSINNLREKYKDKINIKLGFEAEYMDEYFSYYKSLLDEHKIEYLILGQHCIYKNQKVIWYVTMDSDEGLIRYTEDVIKGIESGLFTYIAHPDLFILWHPTWDDLAISCSKKIINCAIKHKMPLEINLCKIRARKYGYIEKDYPVIYPYTDFWKLVATTKAHVIAGVDSHFPKQNIMSNNEILDEIIKDTGVKVDFNYRIK